MWVFFFIKKYIMILQVGFIVYEIVYSIGFYYEYFRLDWDDYVIININNI